MIDKAECVIAKQPDSRKVCHVALLFSIFKHLKSA